MSETAPGIGFAPAAPMTPELFRVVGLRLELGDTVTLELEAVHPGGNFSFAPGQFNMLYVFGVGEVPISISGDPADGGVLAHTVRAVGTVSDRLRELRRGDMVGLRGPFGSSWPVAAAEHEGKDVVIMAGGIGLAPLRPAVYYILRHRAKFRRVNLLYGARTPGDILFPEQLEEWRGHLDWNVEVTVDSAPGVAVAGGSATGTNSSWRGRVGVVTKLVSRAQFTPGSTLALLCGPEIMMRFSVQELVQAGLREDEIFVSMERNMKCAVGFCGHCQYGPHFICKDGPVFNYARVKELQAVREL